MSGRSAASTSLLHLLLAVSLSASSLVCRAEMEPHPHNATTHAELPEIPPTQIKLLTIKTIVSTLVSTVSHTVMLYPTCTTAGPDVSACPGANTLPPHLTSADPPTVAVTPTPPVPGDGDDPSTTSNLMEVVLPSCDCGGERGNNRTPRLMQSEDVITLKTTTTRTVDRVFTATAQTTVSLTYNGCVPPDAISTTPCLPSSTSTTTTTTTSSSSSSSSSS